MAGNVKIVRLGELLLKQDHGQPLTPMELAARAQLVEELPELWPEPGAHERERLKAQREALAAAVSEEQWRAFGEKFGEAVLAIVRDFALQAAGAGVSMALEEIRKGIK